MEERAWWTWLSALALGLAFIVVSVLLWANGGRGRALVRAKLRLGGLLLGLGVLASGCGDKDDSNAVMCYEASWDSDTAAQPDIEVDSTSLDFGTVAVGQTAQQTLTVRNNGSLVLTIASLELSEPVFTVDATLPLELATGAEQTVTVTFAPTAPDAYVATLTIGSDDPDHPSLEVNLAGGGVVP